MRATYTPLSSPIDAVITWVDGNTPSHRRSRAQYMAKASAPLHENAVNPHRWGSNDEILYCIQSIANFAPWTRTIWIVVDSEVPDLSALSADVCSKIKYVYHRDIFGEFQSALPTFNSLAIESLIWRIEGLSERFLYFNDDVFLTAPLTPSDVFEGFKPVLRGRWADFSDLAANTAMQSDPAKFNYFMQINAASMIGFDAARLFRCAHVVHPLRRTVMAQLFNEHTRAFVSNIGCRFRDLSQFLPQGLHNHACIAAGSAVISSAEDHLHIKSGQGASCPPSDTWALLQRAKDPGIKFLCANDWPQLEALLPEARPWLSNVIGGFDESGGAALASL